MQLRGNTGWAAVAVTLVVLAGTGCGTGGVVEASGDASTRGKQLFQERCGSCHVLADAEAQGRVGPDLDAVFGANYAQGFEESTVRQVVADQIKYAGDFGTEGPTMPQDLVTGDDVDAVATYVAAVAGGGPEGAAVSTGKPPISTPGATGTTTGDQGPGEGGSAAGEDAFASNGCGSCHTFGPAGTTGTVGPNLDQLPQFAEAAGKPLEEFIREGIVDPNAYVEKGFPQGIMPPFDNLDEATLDALVEFLATAGK